MKQFTPTDPTLVQVNNLLDMSLLMENYPWTPEPSDDEFIEAFNLKHLSPGANNRINRLLDAIVLRQETCPSVIKRKDNDLMEELIRGLDLWRVDGALTKETVHQNQPAQDAGLTSQHWVAALAHWDRADLSDHSDGLTVRFWHRPTRGDREFHFRVEHKHWWENDPTQYVRIEAYHAQDMLNSYQPAQPAGSALFIWPWI